MGVLAKSTQEALQISHAGALYDHVAALGDRLDTSASSMKIAS
jgi:hypothetical protein